jgi:hypothetical protein
MSAGRTLDVDFILYSYPRRWRWKREAEDTYSISRWRKWLEINKVN